MFGINTTDPPMYLKAEDHAGRKTLLGDLHASLVFNALHSTIEQSKSPIPPLPHPANSSYAVL
jgi:hypothetical protein